MKPLTPADVIARLEANIALSGLDQKQYAARQAVSPQYLSDMLKGARPVSDRVLATLGLERVRIVRRKAKS